MPSDSYCHNLPCLLPSCSMPSCIANIIHASTILVLRLMDQWSVTVNVHQNHIRTLLKQGLLCQSQLQISLSSLGQNLRTSSLVTLTSFHTIFGGRSHLQNICLPMLILHLNSFAFKFNWQQYDCLLVQLARECLKACAGISNILHADHKQDKLCCPRQRVNGLGLDTLETCLCLMGEVHIHMIIQMCRIYIHTYLKRSGEVIITP